MESPTFPSIAQYKVFSLVGHALEMFGYDTDTNITRRVINFTADGTASNTDKLLEVTETTFDGVKVRLYRSKISKIPSPAVVHFHGGGWTVGKPEMTDHFNAEIAKNTGFLLVSVDYRLAPEHPLPIPFEDCVTATLHLLKSSEKYGINSKQVAVAGDSAGGNLAAAVALYISHNPQLPQISFQILLYPCIQPIDFQLPSWRNPEKHTLLTPKLMAEFWSNYFGHTSHSNLVQAMLENRHTSPLIKKSKYADYVSIKINMPKRFLDKVDVEPTDIDSGNETLWKEIESKALNPYMSPLLASDLDKVAPAVVVTAEHDILRDEGIMYAERLRKSGIKVKHRNYNMLHGFVCFTQAFQISRIVTNDIVNDLKEQFGLGV